MREALTPARIREEVRRRIDPAFDWVRPGPLPWAEPARGGAALRVVLVSTGGLHLRGDRPFRAGVDVLGDTSFRLVPHGALPRELALSAPYVDRRFAGRDPEVVLPARALERLYREGIAGRPSPLHVSFTAGIVRPLPGLAESGEQVLELLRREGVEAAVLLPSCSLCVQTVCLLARTIEAGGTPTVTLSPLPAVSAMIGAPRTLAVRFPLGAPCGDPGNRALHRAVLHEALALLGTAGGPGTTVSSRHSWRRSPVPPRSCSSQRAR